MLCLIFWKPLFHLYLDNCTDVCLINKKQIYSLFLNKTNDWHMYYKLQKNNIWDIDNNTRQQSVQNLSHGLPVTHVNLNTELLVFMYLNLFTITITLISEFATNSLDTELNISISWFKVPYNRLYVFKGIHKQTYICPICNNCIFSHWWNATVGRQLFCIFCRDLHAEQQWIRALF